MNTPTQNEELMQLRHELAQTKAELSALRAAQVHGSRVLVQGEGNVAASAEETARRTVAPIRPGGGVKVEIELPSDLIVALNLEPTQLSRPAREWILLELFHEGLISSGKAAQLLGLSKAGFLQLLDQRGLPYLDMDLEELERQAAVAMAASRAPRPV